MEVEGEVGGDEAFITAGDDARHTSYGRMKNESCLCRCEQHEAALMMGQAD